MNADELKVIIARHFRYDGQCPFVAFEAGWDLDSFSSNVADVLAVDKQGFLLEAEIKISLADLRKDAGKNKHELIKRAVDGNIPTSRFGNEPLVLTHLFYFAVPRDIANQAKPVVESLYPYAGLIAPANGSTKIQSFKVARPISDKRLTLHQFYRMALEQSGTLCRLAEDVAEARRVNIGKELANKELREQLRLYQGNRGAKVEVLVPHGTGCSHCPLLNELSNGSFRCGYSQEELKTDRDYYDIKKGKKLS